MDSRPEIPLIEDVKISTGEYIKKHHLWTAVFLVIIFIVLEVLIVYEVFFAMRTHPGWMIFPIMIPLFGYMHIHGKISQAFFEQFALKNGFTYQKRAKFDEKKDSQYLSTMGIWSRLEDVISGAYKGHPLRLYNFSTRPLARKYRYSYTVFEIEYAGYIEGVIVDCNIHPFSMVLSGSRFAEKQRLVLEGNFNKHIDVYIPEGCHIEALSILTPEIMEKIVERVRLHSFEFRGNKLYIISAKTIHTKAELEEMFEFATWLITTLTPRLERMKRDEVVR